MTQSGQVGMGEKGLKGARGTNSGETALVAREREHKAEEGGGDAKRTLDKAPDGHGLGGEQELCKVLARVVLERCVCDWF